ncbi:hypothetical protein FOXYSP1_15270 [Fusarium oxysporum f. sp. phaseoli]
MGTNTSLELQQVSVRVTRIYSCPRKAKTALKWYKLSVFYPKPLRRVNSLPLLPAAALTIGRCLVETSRKGHLDESDDVHLLLRWRRLF